MQQNKNARRRRKSKQRVIMDFREYMNKQKYLGVPLDAVLTTILTQGLEMPPRATPDNALQDQNVYPSENGYFGKALTGTTKGVKNPRGSAWVHISNETDTKLLWTREFYRDSLHTVLARVAIYAHLAKNIIDGRPDGMDLIKVSETEIAWTSKDGKTQIPILIKDYLQGIDPEDQAYIIRHEIERNSYLRRSAGKVIRQSALQSKWKKKKVVA